MQVQRELMNFNLLGAEHWRVILRGLDAKRQQINTDGDPSDTVGLYSPPQSPAIAAGHWP